MSKIRLNLFDKFLLGTAGVLTLLAIAGSLTVTRDRRGPGKTEVLVAMLEGACKQYRMEWGAYPPAEPDGGTSTLFRLLQARRGSRDGYVQLPPEFVKDGRVVDEWGGPVRYASPGRRNRDSIDLWSAGRDGREGGEDDVTNWLGIP